MPLSDIRFGGLEGQTFDVCFQCTFLQLQFLLSRGNRSPACPRKLKQNLASVVFPEMRFHLIESVLTAAPKHPRFHFHLVVIKSNISKE